MCSRNRDFLDLTAHQRPMTGDTKLSPLVVDHLGWLLCDGRLLNVSDYRFLFDVIGYSFGSNVSGTQFQLPDPAGRVPGFVGSGSGLTTRALGSNVGAETHTLTVAEMPTHSHGVNDPGHTHTYNSVAASLATVSGGPADNTELGTNTTGSSTTGITLSNTGGSNAHNIMQPTLFLGNLFMYCGKYRQGNFPFTTGTNLV